MRATGDQTFVWLLVERVLHHDAWGQYRLLVVRCGTKEVTVAVGHTQLLVVNGLAS